jgi:tripartite-type tricarboxylate transporter receptor subunit TctC
MDMRVPRRALLVGATAGLTAPSILRAQAWPAGTIRLVVPFAPGGSTDIVSRLLAERMTSLLGQPVQVENRAGANTIIGAEFVARARPDGHTLLMAAGTTLTINPVIVPNLPYKLEDFAPVFGVTGEGGAGEFAARENREVLPGTVAAGRATHRAARRHLVTGAADFFEARKVEGWVG